MSTVPVWTWLATAAASLLMLATAVHWQGIYYFSVLCWSLTSKILDTVHDLPAYYFLFGGLNWDTFSVNVLGVGEEEKKDVWARLVVVIVYRLVLTLTLGPPTVSPADCRRQAEPSGLFVHVWLHWYGLDRGERTLL